MWPWLYAVQPGQWNLTGSQAQKLRDYIDRGGLLHGRHFRGDAQWAVFEASMNLVFPTAPPWIWDDAEPIFHSVYDLSVP